MARRARQRVGGGWMLAAAVGVAGLLGVGFWVANRDSEPYRTVPVLEVEAYLENANSLRGNVYQIEGEVVNSLAWSPASGRLIAVGASEEGDILPVLVTPDFNEINIQKGQKYIFLLEVDKEGILVTKNLQQL